MASARLERVLKAWELSHACHEAEPGVPADAFERAERTLKRSLPPVVAELYEAVGSGAFVGGNFTLHPLFPSEDDDESLALTTASDLLRSWGWPVPEEMVIFGDDGTGNSFGLWVPAQADAQPLVVQIGEIFEDGCLAVVGDDLASFLLGWTAYYLPLVCGADTDDAAAALGVPDELRARAENGSRDALSAALLWSSPALPDPCPDPYERGLTRAAVLDFARRSGSTSPG